MMPEPFVSTALASGKEGVTQLFDLNALWNEATGQELPMGVLVARKSFVEERADDLAVLLADYQTSVDFVNNSPATLFAMNPAAVGGALPGDDLCD